MKNLSKNWSFLDKFCYSPNNYERVSNKIAEFHKEKTMSKEHNTNHCAKSKKSSHDLSTLDRVRLSNADYWGWIRLVIGHLNIHSLKNKFEMLRQIAQNKLDILLISETKVDPSFPSSQFAKESLSSPFRLDRNSSGSGTMLFVREEFLQNS